MSKAKEILNKLNETKSDFKFKPDDFVVYYSGSGPQWNCFAIVGGNLENGKVLIKPLCKINGDSDLNDVGGGSLLEVNEYSLKLGSEVLAKKIKYLKNNLQNLEDLYKETVGEA